MCIISCNVGTVYVALVPLIQDKSVLSISYAIATLGPNVTGRVRICYVQTCGTLISIIILLHIQNWNKVHSEKMDLGILAILAFIATECLLKTFSNF